jgi:alanine-glyoxylate transaminase / serine-glyoxylate transaminase / serine-pyruvate transaminase
MDKLLLIPGPSPVHPRILDALAAPTVAHTSPEMAADMTAALAGLKTVVSSTAGEPFVIAGAGTLSMEMAILNVTGSDDRVLVLSQGYFGDRMEQICRSFGLAHDVLRAPWGEAIPPEQLAAKLAGARYSILAVTHVDTSTGACAPIEAYGRVLKDSGILYIVDGVCATGGIDERMDDWGIDIVLTAAQKAFGVPPGLAICVFSERAVAKRKSLASVPAYYTDILRWLPIMKDPTKYFSTHGVNEIRAFAEGIRIMMEEGMPARYARHARIGASFRASFAALGFPLFTKPEYRAETISVPLYPEGVADAAFRAGLARNGVAVAGGLAETAGKLFRVGHMGNLSTEQILFAVGAVEKTLAELSYPFAAGTALAAARAQLG